MGSSNRLPNLAGIPAWLVTSLILGVPIVCFVVIVLASGMWISSMIKRRFEKDMKTYQEKKTVFDRDELPRWQRAKVRWEQLHYCMRDESLLIFGENNIILIGEMETHLYKPI